jgi:hypothetical protein
LRHPESLRHKRDKVSLFQAYRMHSAKQRGATS